MHRLLQGEVGSGKTVVALRAMVTVVDAGGQAALLAPTEVLAQQHFRTMTAMLGPLADGGLLGSPPEATRVRLLTGSQPAARAAPGAARHRVRRGGHRRRHPRAAAGARRLLRPRAGGRRRAAPVRRRAARGPARQGGDAAARPGDDGNADPAHGRDDDLRRPRRLDADRAAAGTAADQHPRGARRPIDRATSSAPGNGSPRRSRRVVRPTSCVRASVTTSTPAGATTRRRRRR